MQINIGNYVMTPDGIQQVEGITAKLIDFDITSYFIDEVKGVKLSVEWLKKSNYKQLKRVEKTYSLGDFEDNSAIYYTGVRFIHVKTGTHLEFVHEWQNLYASIYKQELKFI